MTKIWLTTASVLLDTSQLCSTLQCVIKLETGYLKGCTTRLDKRLRKLIEWAIWSFTQTKVVAQGQDWLRWSLKRYIKTLVVRLKSYRCKWSHHRVSCRLNQLHLITTCLDSKIHTREARFLCLVTMILKPYFHLTWTIDFKLTIPGW